MAKKLIFVSCGQQKEEEKALGQTVQEAVNATDGFEAYFAESVHDLDSLGQNIFDALYRCSGAVIFLHERGKAFDITGKEWGRRSSVWINQEIAILAYRQFREGRKLPILVFKEENVKLEGAMTALIVNPIPLKGEKEIVEEIRNWLSKQSFPPDLNEIFQEKWKKLSEPTKRVLSCLINQGGRDVKMEVIRKELIEKHEFENNQASDAVKNARKEFINTDLVKFKRDINSGHEFSVHPTWEGHLQSAILKWNKMPQKAGNS